MRWSVLFFFLLPFVAIGQTASIPTVVHVLWNEQEQNIPDSLIHQTIELVNKDFRRENDDADQTPSYFLGVAADTEIEFVLATTDPNGNPTNGITRTFTDSTEFWISPNSMKFTTTGGKDAWNTCAYLNIWVVPELTTGYIVHGSGLATRPGTNADIDGIVVNYDRFEVDTEKQWRVVTQLVAQYLDLYFIVPASYGLDGCFDVDSVSDTPISVWNPWSEPTPTCQEILTSCNNGPNGDMYMNFMASPFGRCKNLFTQGQKDRMHSTLDTLRQGLLNQDLCALGIGHILRQSLVLSPNPATDFLHFQTIVSGHYNILDMQGRSVLFGTVNSGKNQVDVTALSVGVYFMRIQNEEYVSSARFVKN